MVPFAHMAGQKEPSLPGKRNQHSSFH